MAINSVPLGQAGTGAAVILGEDNVAQQFNQNLNRYRQRQQQLAEEDKLRAQEIAQSYRKNMLAASDGKLFANQLGDLEQKHIKQGMDYRAQGWDVYNPNPNDPKQIQAAEQYQSDRRTIENLRNYRKGLETQFNKVNEAISKARAGEYKQSDIQAMHDFINGTDILEAYNSGAQLPSVNKAFNTAEALKGIRANPETTERLENGFLVKKTTVDADKAKRTVLNTLSSTDAGQEYLNDLTGGMPVNEVLSLPKTKDEIRKRRESDYNGIPQLREYLASQQIQKGNSAYNRWLDEEVNRQYEAVKNLDEALLAGANRISGGFPLKDSRIPDYRQENQQYRRNAESRAQTRFNERNNTSSDNDLYYTIDFMKRMFAGARGEQSGVGSGEELGSILDGKGFATNWTLPNGKVKNGATYHVEKLVDNNNNPTGKLRIITAPKIVETGSKDQYGDPMTKTIPSRSIVIDGNNEYRDRSKLNSFLKDVTDGSLGLKESQVRTNQASGKIKGTQPTKTSSKQKSTTTSAIKSLVGKKGYEGYTEKELIDYYRSQGYNIK